MEILNNQFKSKILESTCDILEANIDLSPSHSLAIESKNIQAESIEGNADFCVLGMTCNKQNFSVCEGNLAVLDSDNCQYETSLPAVMHSITIPNTKIQVSIATYVLPASHGSLFMQSFLTDKDTHCRVMTNKRAAYSLKDNMSHRDTRKLCQELHNRALAHKLNIYKDEIHRKNLYSKIDYKLTTGFLMIKTPLSTMASKNTNFVSICCSA